MSYKLFAGQYHYPKGGYDDFIQSGDSIDYLKSVAIGLEDVDWVEIVLNDDKVCFGEKTHDEWDWEEYMDISDEEDESS